VAPLLAFDKLIELETLGSVLTQTCDGAAAGCVRELNGVAGGPFDGKWVQETCVAANPAGGHTYSLHMREFGDPAYALPVEVEDYMGTFFVQSAGEGKCMAGWVSHWKCADPPLLKGMLEGMIAAAFDDLQVGFGSIVVSEIEALNLLVNLV
jgi:hypothetical protein